MVNNLIFSVVLIAVIAAVTFGLIAAIKEKQKRKGSQIWAKEPLTKNEQPMYFRLIEAFPEHVILAQVAFSALLTSKGQATRNRFNRKVADFVICTKAFNVLAIVELDDSSHRSREKQDAERDTLLTSAGYRVLRYKQVPDVERIRSEIMSGSQPTKKNNESTRKFLEKAS